MENASQPVTQMPLQVVREVRRNAAVLSPITHLTLDGATSRALRNGPVTDVPAGAVPPEPALALAAPVRALLRNG